jgi:hypothetical protein
MSEGERAFPLRGAEITFLAAIALASGGIALLLGKDADWDFLNYHWYNPYAFLTGRMGVDVAVAHHATYYNPLPDIPFYLIATSISSAAAVFALGAAQGLNAVPLYWMSRATLAAPYRLWGAGLITLLGLSGSMTARLIGKNNNDNLLSVLVLFALAIVVCASGKLAKGGRTALLWSALAGFLVGSAAGLKPVEAIYAMGLAAALLVIPGRPQARLARLAAGALGGASGVLIFGGFWFLTLAKLTGNPLFPYFNDLFGSPLALEASYRDLRFIPEGLIGALSYPFRFSIDYRLADDMPFRDFRVLAAYVAVPLSLAAWAAGRAAHRPLVMTDGLRIIFAFAGASYVAWLLLFGIYRYLITLEMLAPLLIVGALGLIPASPRVRLFASGIVLLALALATRYDFGPRAGLSDPHVRVDAPEIPDPSEAMILTSGYGEPTAFIIPELPPEIPVLRIQGFLAGPDDGSRLTAMMRERVAAHRGALYLLTPYSDGEITGRAVKAYALRLEEARCSALTTSLTKAYRLCPLTRLTMRPS